MRHAKLRARLSRTKSHRKATVTNIIRGLFAHERVITTVKKAKVTSSWADKLITLAKKNNLAAIRKVESILHDKELIGKLFKEIGPRFENRKGGYTRVIRYSRRRGDGSELAILELTQKSVMPEQEPVATESGVQSVSAPVESKSATAVPSGESMSAQPAQPQAQEPQASEAQVTTVDEEESK